MIRPLSATLATALLLAAPAGADPTRLDALPPATRPDPVLGPVEPEGHEAGAPPAEQEPESASRSGARAGLGWIGLFADGMSFRVPRDGVGLDLQGGAYLQLLRNVSLRGSYRIFDYDFAEGDSSFETDYHGPFLGLKLSF